MKKTILILTVFSFVAGLIILKSVLPANNNFNDAASPTPSKTEELSPNLNQTETIETFFNLISSNNFDELFSLLHSKIIPDNEAKNNWLKQFSALKSITVDNIAKLNPEAEIYRVQLTVGEISSEASGAAIPNYGWNKGENVRWLTLEKENDVWKISQIATGP